MGISSLTLPRQVSLNHCFRVPINISRLLSQQILFTTQNVLTRQSDRVGYALLKVIAAYLEYHMYLTLDVETETTLAAGEVNLLKFQQLLEVSRFIQS